MSKKPFYIRTYKRDTKNKKAILGPEVSVKPYKKRPKRRPVGKLSAPPAALEEAESKAETLGHMALDIIGFLEIPIGPTPVTIGAVADGANGIWYLRSSYKDLENFFNTGVSIDVIKSTAFGSAGITETQRKATEHLTDAIAAGLFGGLSLISIFPGIGDIVAKGAKAALLAKKPKAMKEASGVLLKSTKELNKALDAAKKAGVSAEEIAKIKLVLSTIQDVAAKPGLFKKLSDIASGTYKVVTFPARAAARVVGVGSDVGKALKIKNQANELINPEKNQSLRDKLNMQLTDANKSGIIDSLVKKYLPSNAELESIIKKLSKDANLGDVGEALLAVFALGGGISGGLLASAAKSSPNAKIILQNYGGKIARTGTSAVLLGDSQMNGHIGLQLKNQLSSRGVKVYGGPGTALARGGRSINQTMVHKPTLDEVKERQPDNIFVQLGGNGSVSNADSLVKKLHEISPKSVIIFMGPPPTVRTSKGSTKYLKYWQSRKRKNETIKKELSGLGYVKFVNPYNIVRGYYKKGGDGLHMTSESATKYVRDVLLHKPEGLNKFSFLSVFSSLFDDDITETEGVIGKVGDVGYGKYEGKRAAFLPNEIRVGGSRSWRNNNPGNLRLTSAWRLYGAIGREKYGGEKDAGHAVFETYEDGFNALKKYVRTYMKNRTFLEFGRKIYAPINPDAWARNVARRSGASSAYDLVKDYDLDKIAKAIQKQEGYFSRGGKVIPK
tara:strand:- start:327 stop:2507 length:2181 start_codon:yes stop_codon:yes gene_type:complete